MSALSLAPNAPFSKPRDFAPEITTSHELDALSKLIGPPRTPVPIDPSTRKPIDSTTLWAAYTGRNEVISATITYLFETSEGWWSELLPRRRSEELGVVWSDVQALQHILDPAPEDVAPRYVTVRSTEHSMRMARYNLGLKERGDFFKTEAGQLSYTTKLQILVQATMARARCIVTYEVLNCKIDYIEQQKQYGPEYTSFFEAMYDEIDNFAALTRDELGIYKLQGYVDQVTSRAKQPFDMVIVPQGTMSALALSNAFETDTLRRGAIAERHLSGGARTMTNVLKGRRIYEDTPAVYENAEAHEIEPFRRTVYIGGYIMIDGSDMGDGFEDGKYRSRHALSVFHASMDVDAYKEWKYEDALTQCGRFENDTPEGRITPMLDRMLRELPSAIQRAGVSLQDGLVDSFLFRLPSAPMYGQGQPGDMDGRKYRVVTVFGDMEQAYLTNVQCEKHGRIAAAKVAAELGPAVMADVEMHRALIAKLYNVTDVSSQRANAFLFAVGANPLNAPVPGTTSLRDIRLPYRDAAGNLYVPTDAGPLYVVGTGPAGAAPTAFVLSTAPDGRIQAPPMPIGYGSVPGVAALAALYDSGDYGVSGWDVDVLKAASVGNAAFLRYASTWRRIYPNSVFFDPNLAPAYASTGDPDQDAYAAFAASIYDRTKQPVMVRVVSVGVQGGRSMVLTPNGDADGIETADGLRTDFLAAANDILLAMGYAYPGDADLTKPVIDGAKTATLADIVTSPARADDRIRTRLLDPVQRRIAFDAFRGIGLPGATSLAASYYENVLRPRIDVFPRPASAAATTFAHYFEHEVLRVANRVGDAYAGGAAEALLASAMNAPMQGHTTMTVGTLNEWAERGRKRRQTQLSQGFSQEPGAVPIAAGAISEPAYVNSRLVIAPRAWADIGNVVGTAEGLARAQRMVARPVDPQQPFTALAPMLNTDAIAFRNAFERAQTMCATEGGLNGTVLKNAFVLSPDAVNANAKRPRTSYEDDAQAYGAAAGSACDPLRELVYDVGTPLDQRVNLATRFAYMGANASTHARIGAQLMITSVVCKKSLLVMASENVPPPVCCFAMVNWHIALRTDAVLFASSGRETGELLYNFEDMRLQYDAAHKIWGGHLSVWMGAYIKRPERLLLIPDAAIAGYVGGLDDRVYDDPDNFKAEQPDYTPSAFVFEWGGNFSRSQAMAQANPLSLKGKYLPSQAPPTARWAERGVFSSAGQQSPNFIYYNYVWNLNLIGSDVQPDASTYARLVESTGVTGLNFMRRHLGWNPRDFGFSRVLGDTGHLRGLDPPFRPLFSNKIAIRNTRINGMAPSLSTSTVEHRMVVAS